MELIDRYLQAIKFWLPKQQGPDIIAELSEDIHAQVEEQESLLGRKLNEAEVAALLKQRGRPMLVANRYLPQQHLIGPVLFPIYRLVLKSVALCYAALWVLGWIGLIVFSRTGGAGSAWESTWGSLWFAAFVAMGVVTLVFAILDRTQAKANLLGDWDPYKLPAIRNPRHIPRSSSIIELVVNLFAFGWWAENMVSPIVLRHPAIQITLSALWGYFFWGFLLLTLVNAALAFANLVRPYQTRMRASVRLLNDAAGAALFCWLLKANVLTSITMTNVAAAKTLELTSGLNWWMAKMFPAAIIAGVAIVAFDVFKLVKARPADGGPARQATAIMA